MYYLKNWNWYFTISALILIITKAEVIKLSKDVTGDTSDAPLHSSDVSTDVDMTLHLIFQSFIIFLLSFIISIFPSAKGWGMLHRNSNICGEGKLYWRYFKRHDELFECIFSKRRRACLFSLWQSISRRLINLMDDGGRQIVEYIFFYMQKIFAYIENIDSKPR